MENAKNKPIKGKKINTSTVVGVGLLTAIVIVLQFISMALRFGNFSITLTLIPIVVGAALYGRLTGAWLGFVFGVAVLLTGDATTFLVINVFGTIVTVLVKGALAGLVSAVVYRFIAKKNEIFAVLAASIVAPLTNTGIFLLGCRIFFYDTVKAWGDGLGFENVFLYMVVGLVGINFLIELGTNLILNPVILRIIKIGRKKLVK